MGLIPPRRPKSRIFCDYKNITKAKLLFRKYKHIFRNTLWEPQSRGLKSNWCGAPELAAWGPQKFLCGALTVAGKGFYKRRCGSPQRHRYGQGRRQGALGHAPPPGNRRYPCDCSAPSNRECFYRENVVESALRRPAGAFQRRKVPPKSFSNDDRTAPSLGEVARS